ncbi:hypothetical protein MBLNU230_g4846t1 [Neophaeotheca triangularis]
MPLLFRRSSFFPLVLLVSLFSLVYYLNTTTPSPATHPVHRAHYRTRPKPDLPRGFKWKDLPQHYPVDSFTSLPTGAPTPIPKIQHDFEPESEERKAERQRRLRAVKEAFMHSWEGYKKHAWLQDEVAPISGKVKNTFGGWGATLVDTLDTLWIMGLKKEFVMAVHSLKHIDFTITDLSSLNVFETTIRYLGGLLSAYDLSGQVYHELLDKAIELGEMLYVAFDTPNRLPVTRWDWRSAAQGIPQTANQRSLLAEIGSLTLEFTRLTQLTGDPKYYDAVARITDFLDAQQNHTKIPGLWPTVLDALNADFTKDRTFSLGAMADSTYEYLPKAHLLLSGLNPQYESMYTTFLSTAKKNLFFRPLNEENRSLLLPGKTLRNSATNIRHQPEAQHLACFAGGMVAIAAKTFSRPEDVETARQLTDGCVWAYQSLPTGIMPEIFTFAPCNPSSLSPSSSDDNCLWSSEKWHSAISTHVQTSNSNNGSPYPHTPLLHQTPLPPEEILARIETERLPPGFTSIPDPRYLLRPETIESLFVLYRVTGERYWQDRAWEIFETIVSRTKTGIAFAGVRDVRDANEAGGRGGSGSGSESHGGRGEEVGLLDSMESFWTAETLKYFWLCFEEPGVVSLDEWVLNTEAHPFRRPG